MPCFCHCFVHTYVLTVCVWGGGAMEKQDDAIIQGVGSKYLANK